VINPAVTNKYQLLPRLIHLGGSSPHLNYAATVYNLKRRALFQKKEVERPWADSNRRLSHPLRRDRGTVI